MEGQAQVDWSRLLEQAASSHEPVQINGKYDRAVLIFKGEWFSIEETLCLLSVPRMREFIREGMRMPPDQYSSGLPW